MTDKLISALRKIAAAYSNGQSLSGTDCAEIAQAALATLPSPAGAEAVVKPLEAVEGIHPDVLAVHAQFGGDLEDMNRRYHATMRSALVAPASLPDGWVAVPETALKWLFGEGPDEDGNWFGDGATSDKGRYWWRASFRAMLPAAPANAKGE